ncbi:MAG: rod shape-determining protein MreC [Proteobacteria bacterium]|nr:rod shape-determining protein MreC [Pseudomonadota bacterium]
MEYSPPPLFKQGASARAKVVIFSLLAIILLVIDSRLHTLVIVRQTIGAALYPLQRLALMPRDAMRSAGEYFGAKDALDQENHRLKTQLIAHAQSVQQSEQLAAENAHLRNLLGASERLPVKSLMAEILYDARDAFTRKIVLNRGSQDGVTAGQPVIDDTGVVGQVTRVFLFTSEVTLLTDKDQAIPVQVIRSGLRSVAYGRGQVGVLDLRFMPTNADIRDGDMLVTSGIDGVYPAGLSVAKVVQVETKSTDAFARIVCQPVAGVDRNRQLLVLLTEPNQTPRPPAEESRDKKDRGGKRGTKETTAETKDAKKTGDAQPTAQKTTAAPTPAPATANQAKEVITP